MMEQEILKRLKEDAADIDIPKELEPEEIKELLRKQQHNMSKKPRIYRWKQYKKQIAAAAAIAIICVGGIYGAARQAEVSSDPADRVAEAPEHILSINDLNESKSEGENAVTESMLADSAENAEAESTTSDTSSELQLAKLGTMFTLAGNYEAVYDELQYTEKKREEFRKQEMEEAAAADGAAADGAADNASAESAPSDLASDTVYDDADVEASKEYSATNKMTEGVDESDIVKTDGDYIYMVEDNTVTITDIKNGRTREVAVLTPETQGGAATILELYVDNDKLIVITQEADASLGAEDVYVDACVDIYYMDSKAVTVAYTYDISNPKEPKLEGYMKQDGSYHTSRKADNHLYLFTNYYMELPDASKKDAVTEENASDWIPSVGDKTVAADCIYLPTEGSNSLIFASMDIMNPTTALDVKMVITDYVEVYVSNSAIYLYQTEYGDNQIYTEISKFLMQQGKLEAVNAAAVKGALTDLFSINEYQGYLRVLTTDWSDIEDVNAVYVLDSNLRLVGGIDGIAKGEQIYSARFLKNMGYFVTYRNTDPLFSVDFSDPQNPKLIDELKVTGFSEYLHFWGEDKLLGIGYETDPESGRTYGLKLSMFDISDPAAIVEENRLVLRGKDYSPALYNYKSVLADTDKNLIGFSHINYDKDDKCIYELFSYSKEEGFVSQKKIKLKNGWEWMDKTRGLYSGDFFYLTGNGEIRSYDMTNGFEKVTE